MIPILGFSQTDCDSLEINCCDFSLIGSDTIILQAKNNNLEDIFDYPGFLILSESGDTIAKEIVNYFGIGSGFQNHYLEILEPFIVPFNGTLELHGLFYDTLYCQFPLSIEALSSEKLESIVSIFPNPVDDILSLNGIEIGYFTVLSIDGKAIIHNERFENGQIDLTALKSGAYFISLENDQISLKKQFIKN